MIEVTIQNPASLDFEEYAGMQAEAFAEVVGAQGMGSLHAPEYYRWKYHTPWGSALIATVRKDQKLVAANAMYPLRIVAADDHAMGWQSCDTATLPAARGQGLFMQCLHALQEQLGDDAIFFGFPNFYKFSINLLYKIPFFDSIAKDAGNNYLKKSPFAK